MIIHQWFYLILGTNAHSSSYALLPAYYPPISVVQRYVPCTYLWGKQKNQTQIMRRGQNEEMNANVPVLVATLDI